MKEAKLPVLGTVNFSLAVSGVGYCRQKSRALIRALHPGVRCVRVGGPVFSIPKQYDKSGEEIVSISIELNKVQQTHYLTQASLRVPL